MVLSVSPLSLLRAPPFPWVEPAVAAVSMPGRSSLDNPERLFAAMRAGRVGGAFWGADDPWSGETAGEEAAIVRWIADGTGGEAMRAAAIAVIEAAQYRDPFTGAPIDAHGAVAILAEWRRLIEANRPVAAAVGMAAWKQPAIAQFLWDGRRSPRCCGPAAALDRAAPGSAIAYWPSRTPSDLAVRARAKGVAAWQIEDGFLRSAGLGAECRPPMSVIVDSTGGIHFDPAYVSEIEMILCTHEFAPDLLNRAARLRGRIVAARLGKYGVDQGSPPPPLPAHAGGRRVVLAVGQVGDDLSVRRGGGAGGMAGFLERVRAAEPDAFIVYRPHPDVAAGLRDGGADVAAADLVVTGGSLLALVERADAVHVLSSLTGFEALLRGRAVTVHGAPFYAGWGLTTDLGAVPARRTRRLSIDQLVAGALILGARYRDPVTQLPCPPEILVERLATGGRPAATLLTGFRRALGATRRGLRRAERRA